MHSGCEHRRSQGGHGPPKFLEHTVILCFERRYCKQNGVIRLKSKHCAPPEFLGWLRDWMRAPQQSLDAAVGIFNFLVNGSYIVDQSWQVLRFGGAKIHFSGARFVFHKF